MTSSSSIAINSFHYTNMKLIFTFFFLIITSNLLLAQSSAQVFDKPISISETNNNEDLLAVSVVPNPTSEVLTIETKSNMIQRLEFYTLHGVKVQEANIDNAQKVTVNLYSLKSGDYLLKLFTVKGLITKRFTKE